MNSIRKITFLTIILHLFLFQNTVYAQLGGTVMALEGLSNAQEIVNKSQELITEIDQKVEAVKNSGAYKAVVDGKSLTLPYGIAPPSGDMNYMLVVDGVRLDPVRGMLAKIYMRIPYSIDSSLYFMADEVPLSQSGSLTGDFKLYLLKTVNINAGSGYKIQINGLGKGGYDSTYVTFNCKGFVDVTLNGSLILDPNTVKKYDENDQSTEGTVGEEVKLKFYVQADRLANLIINFREIPDLRFTSLPGFKCSMPELTLDFSDKRNAPAFKLPEWYIDDLKEKHSGDISVYQSAIWQGIYIPNIQINIPRAFTEGAEKRDVVVRVNDVIIDHYGISLQSRVEDLIADANIKGFKYNVSLFELNLSQNTLSKVGFNGGMAFPICKETSKVDFGLTITRDLTNNKLKYEGYADIELGKPLNAEAFGFAQLDLTSGRLDFVYENKQFYPDLTIDGSLVIMPPSKKASSNESIAVIGIDFGNLKIASKGPYISFDGGFIRSKTSGVASKLASLPISFSDTEILSREGGELLGIKMRMNINLQGSKGNTEESNNGFSATTDFTVWTKRNPTNKRWRYDDFDLNAININVDNNAYKLRGTLTMFDGDQVYGKGFCGNIELDVIDKIKVSASAIFGRVTDEQSEISTTAITARLDNGQGIEFDTRDIDETVSTGSTLYRYWFVDASVTIKPGVPIGPGIEINTFTGGLYYKMEMKKESSSGSAVECRTASGRIYEPNKEVHFGLLAGIGLQSTGSGNAFNGEINFGIEFNSGGGIKQLATWGEVQFMSTGYNTPGLSAVADKMGAPLSDNTKSANDNKEPEKEAAVVGTWFVSYDVPNKTLVGDFNIYVNLAGVIKGVGPNNRAGNISVYSAPGAWYLYIGRPTEQDMVGLNLLGIADIRSYFCIGNRMPTPAIAPMPSQINASNQIDLGLVEIGGGMSFGSRLRLEGSPGLPLGLCNARVALKFLVLAGFDVLIAQSVNPVYCSDKFQDRGVNRWYATGQAYFYGSAGLYLDRDCRVFGSGSTRLLEIFISAYVQAQLPRPNYFVGSATVGFRALLKNWEKTFSFKIGDECNTQSFDSHVGFIDGISPSNEQSEVSVSEKIIVSLSNSLVDFEYKISTGQSSSDRFRAVLFKQGETVKGHGLKLMDNNNNPIDFDYEMYEDNQKIVITPIRVLPENSTIRVEVNVITQRKSGDNWTDLSSTIETMAVSFTTRSEPRQIPVKDILYAYPLPNMQNMYKDEVLNGYVRLGVLPNKAVQLAPGYEFNVTVSVGEEEIQRVRNVAYNPNSGQDNFTFALPRVNLDLNRQYTFKVIKAPIPTYTSETQTTTGNVAIGTTADTRADSVVIEYNFKTSQYPTFTAKMSNYNTSFSEVFDGVMAANLTINQLDRQVSNLEGFSTYETRGYVVQNVTLAEKLIQIGTISYDNSSMSAFRNSLTSIANLDLRNAGTTISTVTDALDQLNTALKTINMGCLLEGGGCPAQPTVRIPRGNFTLPINYVLPGKVNANSTHNVIINLGNDIVLPKA